MAWIIRTNNITQSSVALTEDQFAQVMSELNASASGLFLMRVGDFSVRVGDSNGETIVADCLEVYPEGKTRHDYPDGNPNSDKIVLLPDGYDWSPCLKYAVPASE